MMCVPSHVPVGISKNVHAGSGRVLILSMNHLIPPLTIDRQQRQCEKGINCEENENGGIFKQSEVKRGA
jgi:hypothetical protein